MGWDLGENNVQSFFVDVGFMWGKALVYNLEWLRGNTPSSLCAGTGGNNERLLLMPGNPINLGGFVWAGAKEFSVVPYASGTQAGLCPQYP